MHNCLVCFDETFGHLCAAIMNQIMSQIMRDKWIVHVLEQDLVAFVLLGITWTYFLEVLTNTRLMVQASAKFWQHLRSSPNEWSKKIKDNHLLHGDSLTIFCIAHNNYLMFQML